LKENKVSRLTVIGEALSRVGERNAICNIVIRGSFVGRIAASELEAVAVTLKVAESPAVEPITPRYSISDGYL